MKKLLSCGLCYNRFHDAIPERYRTDEKLYVLTINLRMKLQFVTLTAATVSSLTALHNKRRFLKNHIDLVAENFDDRSRSQRVESWK